MEASEEELSTEESFIARGAGISGGGKNVITNLCPDIIKEVCIDPDCTDQHLTKSQVAMVLHGAANWL